MLASEGIYTRIPGYSKLHTTSSVELAVNQMKKNKYGTFTSDTDLAPLPRSGVHPEGQGATVASITTGIFVLFLFLFCFPHISCSSTTIDANVIRNQDGTGECLISSGFPLPEGLVSEQLIKDGKVKVLVNGTEVPANVSALRGRHFDGTLRSMLVQFNYSMSKNDAVPAQVIVDGGERIYADPAYQLPTYAMVQNNNVIVPTSAAYLCSTNLTLRNLLPAGSGAVSEEALYTALAEDRFDALSISEIDGGASYENVSAMLGMWCRFADIKFQKEAVKKTLQWLPYNTPRTDQSPLCKADSVANPDGRSDGQACGMPAEWHFSRILSYAQMYLLTGYRDFWGAVAYYAQMQQTAITSQVLADANIIKLSSYDRPRFNYSSRYGALIAALMVDATIAVDGQYATGRVFDWANQMGWTLTAIENTAWDLKWIPFDTGGGTVPADGTVISQGGATANLLGVYEFKNFPKLTTGAAMPAIGYLQVNTIANGPFAAGALAGISANATGAEESDYRQGMTGTNSNSPLAAHVSMGGRVEQPIFQLIFPTNFLIDYYLYVQRDARIPGMVKTNLDIILNNIRLMQDGDTYFETSGGIWGDPIYGKPYNLEDPVSSDSASPYELPEYGRIIAFVLKTEGDFVVNGFLYSQWYDKLIDTANVSPINILTWQWKLFGQFYGWGQDSPWMMQQGTLVNYGPVAMRVPTQWDTIPNSTPDIAREAPLLTKTEIK